MRKFVVIISFLISFAILGCEKETENKETTDYKCKLTPLSAECFKRVEGPKYDDSVKYGDELTFNETFEGDSIDGQPFSWLIFRSDTYTLGSVEAKVLEENSNQFVSLYSNGLSSPLYNPLDRSLLFTRDFNLDEVGYGVAEADIYLPSENNNELHFEVTTGAVNVIGINIKQDGKLTIISGGVYHNYTGMLEVINTNVVLSKDTWYRLRLEWNRETEKVKASYYDENDELQVLYEGDYHISVRVNIKRDGMPIVPNVVRFSMPKSVSTNGYAYIDNIKVDKVIEGGDN